MKKCSMTVNVLLVSFVLMSLYNEFAIADLSGSYDDSNDSSDPDVDPDNDLSTAYEPPSMSSSVSDPDESDPDESAPSDDNMRECTPEDNDPSNSLSSMFGTGSGNLLKFSDGFSCYYDFGFNQIVDCFMDYFGFDHNGGFRGCQRSVLDLQGIFDFIKHYTGCDLINEPNTKCKSTHQKGKGSALGFDVDGDNAGGGPMFHLMDDSDPDDDDGGDSGDRDDYDSVINPTGAGDLNITSRRNFVKISYVEGNAIGGGFLGGFMPSPISILPSSSEANAQGNDGPDFPLPTVAGNSMRVIKDGRFNANYTIEINGYGGARRLLLLLTGKSQLWFRLHCYLCSAWMEVTTDCNERVITYSANKPTMHVPLSNNNDSDEDGECSLWKGGSTEETRRREKENKRARKHPKRPKTTTMEPLEEETTTEVPMRAPIKQAFGDQLVPDGAHGR